VIKTIGNCDGCGVTNEVDYATEDLGKIGLFPCRARVVRVSGPSLGASQDLYLCKACRTKFAEDVTEYASAWASTQAKDTSRFAKIQAAAKLKEGSPKPKEKSPSDNQGNKATSTQMVIKRISCTKCGEGARLYLRDDEIEVVRFFVFYREGKPHLHWHFPSDEKYTRVLPEQLLPFINSLQLQDPKELQVTTKCVACQLTGTGHVEYSGPGAAGMDSRPNLLLELLLTNQIAPYAAQPATIK
jgi:ribosomal protein L44E